MRQALQRRWWALGAIALGILAVTLDVTVLTLALPTLAGAVRASESQLQWFVTAYTLAMVVGMLPAGLVADRYGRKGLMVGAVVGFLVGSVACAYSSGAVLFIVARILVGLAGAAMIVVALSLVTVLFDEVERPRAIGIWGAANFLGLPLGPIIGGWILSHLWWGWIFLVNIPVALMSLVAILLLVPESRAERAPRVDVAGLGLVSAALGGLMYGIIEAGVKGFGTAACLLPFGAGLVLLAIFGLWERRLGRRQAEPLVDLGVFASQSFTWSVLLSAFGAMALFGVMFILPQYFEAVRALTPEAAGVRLLPLIAGLVLGAVPADRIAARVGTKSTVALGFLLIAGAGVVGTNTTTDTAAVVTAAWTFATGLGAGICFVTTASSVVAELSAERSGVGVALLQTVIKLGPALGASVLGSALSSGYRAHLVTAGLTASAAAGARTSVFAALALARGLGSGTLAASAQRAFVWGMDDALELALALAAAATLLTLGFLPSVRRDRR